MAARSCSYGSAMRVCPELEVFVGTHRGCNRTSRVAGSGRGWGASFWFAPPCGIRSQAPLRHSCPHLKTTAEIAEIIIDLSRAVLESEWVGSWAVTVQRKVVIIRTASLSHRYLTAVFVLHNTATRN